MLRFYKRVAYAVSKVGKVGPASHSYKRKYGVRQQTSIGMYKHTKKKGKN